MGNKKGQAGPVSDNFIQIILAILVVAIIIAMVIGVYYATSGSKEKQSSSIKQLSPLFNNPAIG